MKKNLCRGSSIFTGNFDFSTKSFNNKSSQISLSSLKFEGGGAEIKKSVNELVPHPVPIHIGGPYLIYKKRAMLKNLSKGC